STAGVYAGLPHDDGARPRGDREGDAIVRDAVPARFDGGPTGEDTARAAGRPEPRVVAPKREEAAGRHDPRLDAIGDHERDVGCAAVQADRDVAARLRDHELHRRRADVDTGVGHADAGEVDFELTRAHVDREGSRYVARELDLDFSVG